MPVFFQPFGPVCYQEQVPNQSVEFSQQALGCVAAKAAVVGLRNNERTTDPEKEEEAAFLAGLTQVQAVPWGKMWVVKTPPVPRLDKAREGKNGPHRAASQN